MSDAIKRRGYVAALVVALLTTLIAVPLDRWGGTVDPIDRLALPIMTAGIVLLLIGFLRSRTVSPRLEAITFGFLGLYFLAQLASALYGASTGSAVEAHLLEFGFWFPTLYAAMVFGLGVGTGVRVALAHFAAAVAIGLPFIVGGLMADRHVQVVYALSQMYLSSAVVTLVMVTFARHTEAMIRARAEMERLAHTDPMTQAANRRRMEHALIQEVERAVRYGEPLSLLMLDVDRFKEVNDEHGHPVGDEVLRELATLLREESRTVDVVGRWGGEEFSLLLPGVDLAGAEHLAERLRACIEAHDFTHVGGITASIGIASLERDEEWDTLVARADRALYAAKRAGRNRVRSVAAPTDVAPTDAEASDAEASDAASCR